MYKLYEVILSCDARIVMASANEGDAIRFAALKLAKHAELFGNKKRAKNILASTPKELFEVYQGTPFAFSGNKIVTGTHCLFLVTPSMGGDIVIASDTMVNALLGYKKALCEYCDAVGDTHKSLWVANSIPMCISLVYGGTLFDVASE